MFDDFDGDVYDRHGTKIGMLTNVIVTREAVDVTTGADSGQRFIAGLTRTSFSGVMTALPAAMWACAYCRGLQPPRNSDGSVRTNCSNCGGARRVG